MDNTTIFLQQVNNLGIFSVRLDDNTDFNIPLNLEYEIERAVKLLTKSIGASGWEAILRTIILT